MTLNCVVQIQIETWRVARERTPPARIDEAVGGCHEDILCQISFQGHFIQVLESLKLNRPEHMKLDQQEAGSEHNLCNQGLDNRNIRDIRPAFARPVSHVPLYMFEVSKS